MKLEFVGDSEEAMVSLVTAIVERTEEDEPEDS